MNINRVTCIGNLPENPRFVTKDGTLMAQFTVVTNHRHADFNGKVVDEAQFTNCFAVGSIAESLQEYAKKNDRVYVEGRLRTRRDYHTEVIVETLAVLKKKEEKDRVNRD